MSRKLFVVALIAAITPTLAFAGQPSATSAHPAVGAHVNAMAGETDAARIETCTTATNTLLDNLEKNDDKAATSDFDATMRAHLSADKLSAVWKQVGSQMGTLQTRGTPQNMLYQSHVIVILPLHFEKGDLNAQVACDADGKIAGFFLRPDSAAPASSG